MQVSVGVRSHQQGNPRILSRNTSATSLHLHEHCYYSETIIPSLQSIDGVLHVYTFRSHNLSFQIPTFAHLRSSLRPPACRPLIVCLTTHSSGSLIFKSSGSCHLQPCDKDFGKRYTSLNTNGGRIVTWAVKRNHTQTRSVLLLPPPTARNIENA